MIQLSQYDYRPIPEYIDSLAEIIHTAQWENFSLNGHTGKDAIKEVLVAYGKRIVAQDYKFRDFEGDKRPEGFHS